MKIRYHYRIKEKTVEREVTYIPFRYILAILISLLEIAAIIGIVVALCYYVPLFYLAAFLTEIVCVVGIAASDDPPEYKVPWLLVVLIVPIAGFMAFFMFYSRKLKKRYVKRLEYLKNSTYKKNDEPLFQTLAEEDPLVCSQARMLCSLAETHLFTDTAQTYFPLGELAYKQMLCDLERAERFIYLEYFIIDEGKFWNSVLGILKKKAADGVEVKVLYDDIGCMLTLPGNYYRKLSSYGIETVPFSYLRGNADSEFNNRNHRKIMVIDGVIGYTGGINIADEYINEVKKFGHWKDSALRLEGDAVKELTKLFVIDFGINVKQVPKMNPDCFPETAVSEPGYLIPFGDGPHPMYNRRVGKSVIQNILNTATRYVYMTSPYLIIDNSLCQSIENAALRGVDVKIIVPHIPDKKIIFAMTRSYYPRLMKAGVEIYEYEPGFIHAKSYLADDTVGMVGSINLDYRSLVHHFENGVWMYRCRALGDLKADLEDTLSKSIRIQPDFEKLTVFRRFLRSVIRIFAPMM